VDRIPVRLLRRLKSMPVKKRSSVEKNGAGKGRAKIKKVMHEKKAGTLKSGSGKKVTRRKQAVAIALSEARKSGAKIPARKSQTH
jgi:hypothetical protein